MALLNQPTDILDHLFKYSLTPVKVRLWQTCKRFHGIIGNLVPVFITIRFVEEGVRLVPLFKQLKIAIKQCYHFNDDKLIQLSKYITHINLSQNDRHNPTITDEGIKHLVNLTYLSAMYSNTRLTDEGIKPLTKLVHLRIGVGVMVTNEGIKNMKCLKILDMDRDALITLDVFTHLPKLKIVSMHRTKVTFEIKEQFRKRGIRLVF